MFFGVRVRCRIIATRGPRVTDRIRVKARHIPGNASHSLQRVVATTAGVYGKCGCTLPCGACEM